MRIARFWVPGQGARLGLCEGSTVRVLSSSDALPLDSFDALVQLARRTRRDLQRCVQDLRASASGSSSRGAPETTCYCRSMRRCVRRSG